YGATDPADYDVATFTGAQTADGTWFSRQGVDLSIRQIDGADEIVVEEWFTHGVARLDEVRTASGDAILADSIDRLVSAAAVFAIDPAPGISLTPSQAAAYQDLVATHWQRASETV
ncbi:MAG: hypothetical protein KDI88_18310, partial [Gammaproteobacteria bacterium]|nr:hypothetical protein [Gammaproteobacteria bacterium]